MSLPNPEISFLTHHLAIWQRYDNQVRADLSSTALKTSEEVFFVDPTPLDPDSLVRLIDGRRVAGIIITNGNHQRAASAFAAEFSAPIYAAAAAEIPGTQEIESGNPIVGNLETIFLEGAAPGELALYSQEDGGSLILGDALINFGSGGFNILPKKYCANQKLMRKSLQKLLAFSFERILFAHGAPIVTGAKTRLAELLESAR